MKMGNSGHIPAEFAAPGGAADMAAYDRLPGDVRAALRNAVLNVSALSCERALDDLGLFPDEVAAMVLAARAPA